MSESKDSKSMPSREALEAAAIIRLVEMNKGQKVQPSSEAVIIMARMIANRAVREATERTATTKDALSQTESLLPVLQPKKLP